mmetsp:Transcript_9646/g.18223  ORF Transcript_9646/g.18223 Transcript_9646/m.18223 type:complete len:206 (+) Transcript_9646:1205-1822(+)
MHPLERGVPDLRHQIIHQVRTHFRSGVLQIEEGVIVKFSYCDTNFQRMHDDRIFLLLGSKGQHDLKQIRGTPLVFFVSGQINIVYDAIGNKLMLILQASPCLFLLLTVTLFCFFLVSAAVDGGSASSPISGELLVKFLELCLALVILVQVALLEGNTGMSLVYFNSEGVENTLHCKILSHRLQLGTKPKVIPFAISTAILLCFAP